MKYSNTFYRVHKLILTYLLILVSSIITVAQIQLQGKVIDSIKGEPVQFATIRVDGMPLGAAADSSGLFILDLHNFKDNSLILICSAIGHSTEQLTIDLSKNVDILFKLKVTSIILKDVVVQPEYEMDIDPEKIIRIGLKNLKLSTPSHSAKALSKNYILENGNYRVYREALINIQDPVGYGQSIKRKLSTMDKIRTLQLRQSFNLLVNQLKFENSINVPLDFMHYNGLKYNLKAKKYEYLIADTLYLKDKMQLLIVARQPKDRIEKSIGFSFRYDIKYYVTVSSNNKKDFKIEQFELNEKSVLENSLGRFTKNTVFNIKMKDQGLYSVPELIESISIDKTYKKVGLEKPIEVISYTLLSYDTVNFNSTAPLLANNYDYDPNYWKELKIDSKIRNDLSEVIDLEKQFAMDVGGNERHLLLDSIYSLRWNTEIEAVRKKQPIYLIIYNSRDALSRSGLVYEPVRDWLVKHGKHSVILIGASPDERVWVSRGSYVDYAFLDNYYLPFSWAKLIGKDDELPLFPKFVLLLPSGEIITSDVPFATSFLDQY